MVKDKYPLLAVLGVRAEKKQEATKLVNACRERLELAEVELSRREGALADCRREQEAARERMLEQAARGGAARLMIGHHDFIESLKETERALAALVEQQRPVVASAAGELERALAALLDAAREEQVVERHRENWQQARKREAERADQKRIDEVGSVLFVRRNAD